MSLNWVLLSANKFLKIPAKTCAHDTNHNKIYSFIKFYSTYLIVG